MVQLPHLQMRSPKTGSQGIWLLSRCASGFGGVALGVLLLVGCGSPGVETSGAKSVSTVASRYEAQLAQHLTNTGSVMYGAYWCPHCADQKAMFQDAVDQIPYVECDADGDNAQPDLCKQKGIQGYPTWEINGQLYPGVKSLEELASLSGFSPPSSP
jgi:glutaredoxin